MIDKLQLSFTSGDEQWILFEACIDRIMKRCAVPKGKAQLMLANLRESQEVRSFRILPPERSIPPDPQTAGLEQFFYSEADLTYWLDQNSARGQSPSPQRPQDKRAMARRAVIAIWPERVPSRDELTNSDLCTSVQDWLKADSARIGASIKDLPGDKTILRAAGRA